MTDPFAQALAAYAIQHGGLTPPDAGSLVPAEQPEQPTRAVLPSAPGSRLAELTELYLALKPVADVARRLQEVKDAIKVELANAAPDAEDVTYTHTPDVALRLRAKTSMRFDTTKFKKDDPLTYARYTTPSTSWELRET